MKTRKKIYAALIITSVSLVYAGCSQDRSNTATETSATGKSENGSTNTEHKTPVKLKEYVTGDWTLAADASGNGDNTAPGRLTFTTEGKYLRYSGQQQTDSGLYRVNEEMKTLYLESQGKGDPAEWKVTISGDDQMTLALRDGNNPGKSGSYTYHRSGK